MALHCTPAYGGAKRALGHSACTEWSELKAAEDVEGSSGVVHMAAIPSALSLLSFVLAGREAVGQM